MILYMFQCHILITDISLLCSCESQSFPGWPFLRKQTSADTILNGLTFSIQLLAAQVVLLQGLSIWGGWAYLLFWFCLILWLCLIFWYPFWLWFSFLRAQEQKKNSLVFLFSSPSSTEWHMIGFSFSRFLSEVFWPSWSYSVPWKTREGY